MQVVLSARASCRQPAVTFPLQPSLNEVTMQIVIPAERAGETRVAATPETVKKLVQLGCSVAVQSGAGLNAAMPDAAWAMA